MPSPARGTEGVLGKRGEAPRASTHVRSLEPTLTQGLEFGGSGGGGVLRQGGLSRGGKYEEGLGREKGGLAEYLEPLRNYLFRKSSKPWQAAAPHPVPWPSFRTIVSWGWGLPADSCLGVDACVGRTPAFLPLPCPHSLALRSHVPSLGLSLSICSKLMCRRLRWHKQRLRDIYRYSQKTCGKLLVTSIAFLPVIITGHPSLRSGHQMELGIL